MFLQWANFVRELFSARKSLLSDVPLTPMTLSLTPIRSHTSLISTVMSRWKWQAPEQNMGLCYCVSMAAHCGCAPPRRVALDTNLDVFFIYYRTIESTAVTFSHTETTSFSHSFYSRRSQQLLSISPLTLSAVCCGSNDAKNSPTNSKKPTSQEKVCSACISLAASVLFIA